jgi:tetratricopeptide (TPR) repeat protein
MTPPLAGDAGLGFFVTERGGTTWFGHNGADEGFQAELTASRDGRVAAAFLANSDHGLRLGTEILRGIAEREGWSGYQPAPLPELPLAPEVAAALAGRYRVHGDEAVELALDGDRLVARSPGAADERLFLVAPGELARRDRTTRYRFPTASGERAAIEIVAPAGGDAAEERSSATRMAAGERLPSELLEAGEIPAAIDAFRRIRRERPEDPAIAEQRLNGLGYQYAGRDRPAAALAVLELAIELYPASANAQDSLADVALASGDVARALEAWRRVLELLPADPGASPVLKDLLREKAETKLRELGGGSREAPGSAPVP